jgi:hypothetical protein
MGVKCMRLKISDRDVKIYISVIKMIVLCSFLFLLGNLFYKILTVKVIDTRMSCLVAIIIAMVSLSIQLLDEMNRRY